MPRGHRTGDIVSPRAQKRKSENQSTAADESGQSPQTRSAKRARSSKVDRPLTPAKTSPQCNGDGIVQFNEEVTTVDKSAVNGTVSTLESASVNVEITQDIRAANMALGRKSKQAEAAAAVVPDADLSDGDPSPPMKAKRKTKADKDADAMPLAARSVGLKMYVGAHTSIAKGVENAITNCVHIGGNAFACFLKSQRKWDNPPLKDENRDAFRRALVEHNYDATAHIVPHGSYLVNLATEDKDKAKQAYDAFLDDLRRCEALGIRYYNFHPGGAGQSSLEDAVTRLANHLNRALSETQTVVPLLENMAGHGTLIGGRFSDLRDVISKIKPEFQSRIGVCIDTCHTFAAGYDLRTADAFHATLKEFDDTVGFKYLRALHLNDSKAPFNSHRDLHQNIGLGFLGLRAFHSVMNEPRFQGLPLILETPCERPDPKDAKKTIEDKGVWATEIKLLESLIGMDPASAEFQRLEKDLSQKGKKERAEMQAQHDKKLEKERKKLAAAPAKGQKTLKDMFGKQAT